MTAAAASVPVDHNRQHPCMLTSVADMPDKSPQSEQSLVHHTALRGCNGSSAFTCALRTAELQRPVVYMQSLSLRSTSAYTACVQ